jgi:hypothetical protein
MDVPRSRWPRLLRGYQVLAVQCCTVILLFVLVKDLPLAAYCSFKSSQGAAYG